MFYTPGEEMDLHIHTSFSDGTLTVPQILERAEEAKLSTISITDHNTIEAYNFLKTIKPKDYFSGKIVTGAEINVVVENNLLECLIYNFDVKKIAKSNFLSKAWLEENAKKIAVELFNKAKTMGLKIRDSFLDNNNFSTGFMEFYSEINSHKENQKFLAANNLLRKRDFFRNGFSIAEGIFSIDLSKFFVTLSELKKVVNDCGGVMVLAHPFGVYNIKRPKKLYKHLAKNHLVDGFECIHYQVNLKQTKFLLKLCDKYNLIKTAGSDFHRDNHILEYSFMSNLKTIIDYNNKLHFVKEGNAKD